ncbi:MAG: hypothetical protein WCY12_01560 [Candidatus Omnitrophota bacterium]
MTGNSYFKKTIILSFCGHLIFFSLFSLTFGPVLRGFSGMQINFWGSCLNSWEVAAMKPVEALRRYTRTFKISEKLLQDKTNKQEALSLPYYVKPQNDISFTSRKEEYFAPKQVIPRELIRKEPVLILYPQLPYDFLLYFKDRQAVHIELMFNITSQGGTDSVIVKRKISSGNLEADLLSMRYINHYLFIQQKNLPKDKWQAVKIDLAPKND